MLKESQFGLPQGANQENKIEKEKGKEIIFEKPNRGLIKREILNYEIESQEDLPYLKNLAEDLNNNDLGYISEQLFSRLDRAKDYINKKDIPVGVDKLKMVSKINDYEKLLSQIKTIKQEKIDFEKKTWCRN